MLVCSCPWDLVTDIALARHTRDVIVKLLAFTFAMIVVPIGSYFATVHTVFKGEQMHSCVP